MYGVGNLYVGGSSVFLMSGFVNLMFIIFVLIFWFGDYFDSKIWRVV